MRTHVVAPTVTPSGRQDADQTHDIDHPAFGQLSAYRIQGGDNVLYGSDFVHEVVMRVELKGSTLRRSLGRDLPYSGETVTQFDMSLDQWSKLISTVNMGEGTQVTLRKVRDGTLTDVPGLPLRDAGATEHARDAEAALAASLAALDRLKASVEEMKLTRAQKEELLSGIGQARRKLDGSVPFVLDSIRKHMEGTVSEAKADLLAWGAARMSQLGFGGDGQPTVSFPGSSVDGPALIGAPPSDGDQTKL